MTGDKMKTEKEFLNTLETTLNVIRRQIREGRSQDIDDDLEIISRMTRQRRIEIDGKAPWENDRRRNPEND